MKKKLLFVLLTSLAGCGAENTTAQAQSEPISERQAIALLEEKGELPKLDRSDSLLGPDANNNGIRDDIDLIIKNRFTVPNEAAAATQIAKSYQASIHPDVNDVQTAKASYIKMSRAINCLYSVFEVLPPPNPNPRRISREFEAMTFNTKPRLLAYIKFSNLLSGTTSTLQTGDTCE